MSLSLLYTHTVVIQRTSQVEDVYGGQTNTWSSSIASYSCRIYSVTGKFDVKDIGGYLDTVQKMIGASADILEADKVIDGTDEYLIKKVYKVYDTDSVHHLECLLEKISN